MVEEGHDDSQIHMRDAQNDGHFHFDRVREREFRFRSVPNWIQAESISISMRRDIFSFATETNCFPKGDRMRFLTLYDRLEIWRNSRTCLRRSLKEWKRLRCRSIRHRSKRGT